MGWRIFLNGEMGGSLVAVVVGSILDYTELVFTWGLGKVGF
jgi:hypothetical protein